MISRKTLDKRQAYIIEEEVRQALGKYIGEEDVRQALSKYYQG